MYYRIIVQNGMLKRRLAELQQRLNATKRSMKSIHERLEANNQRKEELIVSLRRSRDLALIDQRNHHSVFNNNNNNNDNKRISIYVT